MKNRKEFVEFKHAVIEIANELDLDTDASEVFASIEDTLEPDNLTNLLISIVDTLTQTDSVSNMMKLARYTQSAINGINQVPF